VTAALIIFVVTYVVVAVGRVPYLRVDRPGAALCGAVAMVALGGLPVDEAYTAVHMDTLALLLGMMLMASILTEASFFRWVAWQVLSRARSARLLLCQLVLVAGLLSALLVNDTVCLMLTPLVLAIVVEARLPALPYLLALATGSNIGGMATYTGNPQNMLVGASHGAPSFLAYAGHVLPAAALCLAIDAALLVLMFRRQLPAGPLPPPPLERPTLKLRLTLLSLGALALFVVLAFCGVHLAGAAMSAAGLLLLVSHVEPKSALARVDWVLLVFFAGLFVVVHGVERTGALDRAWAQVAPILAHPGPAGQAAFAAVVTLGSNLVSNVPLVLVGTRWVPHLPDPGFAFMILASVSTLAGNLTLFGSMANLIVFEGAREHGKVSFWGFFKHGAVITATTTAATLGVLWLERSLGV
jgi:Na+/H+ antiporter NhaD/arsenite permease-like protein